MSAEVEIIKCNFIGDFKVGDNILANGKALSSVISLSLNSLKLHASELSAKWEPMPEDYLRLSHATNQVADGMWGGLPRPDPVANIKKSQKKLSVGFGPWREKAAECLTAAAFKGELVVYVVAEPQVRSKECELTR